MNIIKYPQPTGIDTLLARPIKNASELEPLIHSIFAEVQANQDNALFELTAKFDKATLDTLTVSQEECASSGDHISQEVKDAIQVARQNITAFHSSQIITEPVTQTMPGITCWRKNTPIESIGLYIPGGTAPLFSTVLMLGIPAILAGCPNIALCTPPNGQGKINPHILYTANLLGIKNIFKVGGSQAIAAMTFGTQSIPKVHKIFGPGNQYVTMAKQIATKYGVAIDMPAGPSEVCVIADKTANPSFVASDLLAQAEHGIDSQVVLISDSLEILQKTQSKIQEQLQTLSRADILEQSLVHAKLILATDTAECFAISNQYAPEHLIIQTQNAEKDAQMVTNAGSVFIGNYTPESLGDYASGTNHSLPTFGFAKNYSGVSVDSFIKKITFQKATKEGLGGIAKTVQSMAHAESLDAHAASISVRL